MDQNKRVYKVILYYFICFQKFKKLKKLKCKPHINTWENKNRIIKLGIIIRTYKIVITNKIKFNYNNLIIKVISIAVFLLKINRDNNQHRVKI